MFFSSDGFDGTIDMALSLLWKMVVCTFCCTKVWGFEPFLPADACHVQFLFMFDVGSLRYEQEG